MGVLFSFWQRVESNRHVRKVTGSKITAFYALLSVTYCALQILFLVASWQVNHTAGNILETIVTTSGNGSSQFTYVENRDGQPTLFLCEDGLRQTTACKVIVPVPPRPINSGVSPTSGAVPPIKVKRSNVEYRHLETGELNTIGISEIRVNGQPFTEGVETLSPLCVNALKWPYHHLLMVRREDIVSVTYQAWLLLMSGVAIFNESIPHIGASFIVHIIALFWSSYQIYTAQKFGQDYRTLIVNGACDGVDLIAEYFSFRTGYQIAATVINFVSLIASGYLTWRLFGAYGWATFKKMGASISIARAYKAALGLSIGVQLSIFFYMASVGLWVDTIRKKLMGADPDFRTLYLVGYTIMTILTLPWMYLAWYGIRRESARLMYSFYFTSVLYLGFSGAMFKSTTFKGFFIRWPFVAVIFSFSVFLVVITIALSVICQLNFGKGLPHYFERRNGEDPEDFNSDFHPSPDEKNDDLEKVAFPSDNVSVSFPSSTASLPRLERHGTAGSYSSVESYGSTRLPPMQLTDVPRLAIPGNEHGRSLTASSTTTSTDSPSWTPGDDKHMMVARPSPAAKGANLQRFDSASSFGQLDSGKFDRDFSFRTTSSASGSGRSPNSPNSKNPVNPFSNANQLGRKRTVDLGNEL